MTERFELRKVEYMPTPIEPGILYVAAKFGAAAHRCACGCGAIVRTPLGPTEWSLEETEDGPSLDPSIGNWQEPCKSHYWIRRGKVVWAAAWSSRQIELGRQKEQQRRDAYYHALNRKPLSKARQIWNWLLRVFDV